MTVADVVVAQDIGAPPGSVARYQIVILEPDGKGMGQRLEATLRHRLNALGVDETAVAFLHGAEAAGRERKAPAAAVYFGTSQSPPAWVTDLIVGFNEDAVPVLPVVDNYRRFRDHIPEPLAAFNGRELDNADPDLEGVAGIVLENLGLLRHSRRVFVSYRRIDSRGVAVQIYEALDAAGFDVFLDTHCIRGSENFQDELWQRLSDVDLVVLLDSPNFLDGYWTEQEFATAHARGIGMVQVVWPQLAMADRAALALPVRLEDADFRNGTCSVSEVDCLTPEAIKRIVVAVEGHRARSIGARYSSIVKDVCSAAVRAGHRAQVHWRRCVVVEKTGGDRVVAVPVIGVPDAVRYHEVDRLVQTVEDLGSGQAVLVYDPAGIRPQWLEHLTWLDDCVPVKGVRVTDLSGALGDAT